MAWRVAQSLDVLLKQLNTLAPNRSKKSDGSIGDAAHASRDSDHNPWLSIAGTGVVTARDFTNDPAGGLDCDWLAKALIAGNDPRIKYLIWNRQIYTPGRGWAAYRGTNPHDHHLHLSVVASSKLFDSLAPWQLNQQTGSPVGSTPTVPKDWFDMATQADLEAAVRNVLGEMVSVGDVFNNADRNKLTNLTNMMDAFKGGPEVDKFKPFFESTAKQGSVDAMRDEGVSGAGDTGRLVAAIMAELPADGSYVSKDDVEAAAERGVRNVLRTGVGG